MSAGTECTCKVEVKTLLSSDTNLVQTGTPIVIYLSGIQKREEDDKDCISAHATGKASGETDVTVEDKGSGAYEVHFQPSTSDDYTIEVKHHSTPVLGSPFPVKVVSKESLAIDGSPSRSTTVKAGHVVDFIIPVETSNRNLFVTVEGPMGECITNINDDIEGSIAVSFVPNMPGSYITSVKKGDSHIAGSPFSITVRGNKPDASKCNILEEDMDVFEKHHRIGKGPARFRVSTENAGHGILDIISRGPGKAEVKITGDSDGIETCEFTPSVPGKYYLDITWSDTKIEGSPFLLHFKSPKQRIVSAGLNLQSETYHIGVPHRFKLNCGDAGEGALQIKCIPSRAATVSLNKMDNTNAYHCEVLPQETGIHELTVKYKGKHIFGSPFNVIFMPNIAKCHMTESSTEHEVGDNVVFHISTAGAGEAKLAASAENIATNEALPVSVTKVSEELYKLELNPGQGMECSLTVMYGDQHIHGSPFKLEFSDSSKCQAIGEGLVLAQVGKVSTFAVKTEDTGPGKLKVKIEGEGEAIKPIITATSSSESKVTYCLSKPGTYKVAVQWGKFDIPGSPFEVCCYEPVDAANLSIENPPKEVHIGDLIQFPVRVAAGTSEEGLGTMQLVIDASTSRSNSTIRGEARKISDGNYHCTLKPPAVAKYTVNVRCNGEHIQGSPFKVRVITPPIPENVKAYGPGLKDGWINEEGKFSVETANAGTGLLAVRIHGPKGAFKITTKRHPENDRVVLVSYNPTHAGKYILEITWSAIPIPGSPFVAHMKKREETIAEETENNERDDEEISETGGGEASNDKPADEKQAPSGQAEMETDKADNSTAHTEEDMSAMDNKSNGDKPGENEPSQAGGNVINDKETQQSSDSEVKVTPQNVESAVITDVGDQKSKYVYCFLPLIILFVDKCFKEQALLVFQTLSFIFCRLNMFMDSSN